MTDFSSDEQMGEYTVHGGEFSLIVRYRAHPVSPAFFYFIKPRTGDACATLAGTYGNPPSYSIDYQPDGSFLAASEEVSYAKTGLDVLGYIENDLDISFPHRLRIDIVRKANALVSQSAAKSLPSR